MWWLETIVLLNNTPLFIQGLSCLTSRLFNFDFVARKVNVVKNGRSARKSLLQSAAFLFFIKETLFIDEAFNPWCACDLGCIFLPESDRDQDSSKLSQASMSQFCFCLFFF